MTVSPTIAAAIGALAVGFVIAALLALALTPLVRRVFVRYEVIFQLAWVLGALIPSMLPVEFREGFLIIAALYLVAGVGYLTPDIVARRRAR